MVCLDVLDQDIRSQNCPCVDMIVISKVLTLLICPFFVLPLVPPLSISRFSLFNLDLHPALLPPPPSFSDGELSLLSHPVSISRRHSDLSLFPGPALLY